MSDEELDLDWLKYAANKSSFMQGYLDALKVSDSADHSSNEEWAKAQAARLRSDGIEEDIGRATHF